MATATKTAEETATVRIEKVLPHPPRRVWKALTRPEALDRWLLPVTPGSESTSPLDAPGKRVQLRAAPNTRISYEVTESEPERRLALHWSVETPDAEREPTTVTWTLTPEQDGAATRLVIEHRPTAMATASATPMGGVATRLAVYLELGSINIARRRGRSGRRYLESGNRSRNREERKLLCR